MTPVRHDIIAINPKGEVHALCEDTDTAPDLIGRFVASALKRGDRIERVPTSEACARHEAYLRTRPEFAEAFAVVDARGEVRS